MHKLFRIEPKLSPSEMKTYALSTPLITHFRKATCKEVECKGWRNGWESFIDESTVLGQTQAGYIRHQSGRRFTESKNEHGITAFKFPAGQTCFREHKEPLERPPLLLVRNGDWRASSVSRVHSRVDDWVDDFRTHTEGINKLLERG